MSKLIYADLTYRVRRAIFNVYNNIGFGHKEKIYQKALAIELEELKVPFKKERALGVKYKNVVVDNYIPDFVIDDKIILELKAVEFMPKSFEAQLIHYLKATEYILGFLINFGTPKLLIKRLVWTGHPRKSALENQRKSMSI